MVWTRRGCLSLSKAATPPETPREPLPISLLSVRPRVPPAHVSVPPHDDPHPDFAQKRPLPFCATAFTLIFSKALFLKTSHYAQLGYHKNTCYSFL